VSGLWDVYDGTAPLLMLGFFQNLKAGMAAPEALSRSQRAFLQKLRGTKDAQPWLHPYFWAVYTSCGDDRTRFGK
jgi:CHAT domain-containing protein